MTERDAWRAGGRYLNGATLMTTPTSRQMEVALAAGFDGIEARAERLVGPENAAERRAALRDLRDLRAAGGRVLSVNGLGLKVGRGGGLDRRRLEGELDELLDLTEALASPCLLVVPPRAAHASAAAVREGLELALRRAGARGVQLGFEFLGFPDCPVNTVARANDLLAGLPDAGFVADTCHLYASGGDIGDVPADRLTLVHLNDVTAPPSMDLEDGDRVLPGEGRIALGAAVASLRARGFDGPWSVETFRESYWHEPPEDVARRAFAALERVLAPDG